MSLSRIIYIFFFLCLTSFLPSCTSNENRASELDSYQKETDTNESKYAVFSLDYPEIKYNLVHIDNITTLNSILNKYKNSEIGQYYRKVLRTLNRKELQFFRVGQDVIVPDSVINDMRAYSIFPEDYPGAKKIEKLIIICNAMQAYACYEYGNLVRFAAANTGKEKTPTFPGRYALVWKQKVRRSSLDSTWVMPYTFNFHQFAGSAMHQFSMPGRPVSHSCVRQFEDDAVWIFSWGKGAKYDSTNTPIPLTGTPLIILNTFNFARKIGGPWLELMSNKSYRVELPLNPMEVEEALIPYVQIPKSSRGVLPNRERYINAEIVLRQRGVIREGVELIQSVDFNEVRRKKEKERLAKIKKEEELKKHFDTIQHNDINNTPE